jgi:RNA polymerase sigma factor (sigma-70 family)
VAPVESDLDYSTTTTDFSRSADAALDRMWERCEPIITDSMRRLWLRDGVVGADDVLQDAALTLIEMFRAGLLTPESSDDKILEAQRKLRWRVRDFVRAERRRLGRVVPSDDEAIDRAIARQGTRQPAGAVVGRRLANALDNLSPRQRAVVSRLYFADQRVAEISAELGVTSQAITALHRRALAAMRRELGANIQTVG